MNQKISTNGELTFSAAILSAFLCALFGANAVAIKISLTGLGVFTTAGFRFSIAAAVIFLWAKVTRKSFAIKSGQGLQLLVFTLTFIVQLSLFYIGVSRTKASHATLLSNLLPFFILFFAHYFIPEERITKRKILGILMGFSGVCVLFLWEKGEKIDFQFGDFIILIVVFIWASRTVYMKKIIDSFESFHLVFYPMIFSVPMFFIEALLWDDPMLFKLDIKVLSALLYQSLVTASFGFLVWTSLLKKYGATSLHSFIFIMPVSGVLLSNLLLGEPLTLNLLFAMLFIVSGILIIHLKAKRLTPMFPLGRNI